MTQDSTFQIGVSDFSRKQFTKKKWFKIERGENLFRILPPVHSYASLGKYYEFYSVHGGFKNAKGFQMKFQCIEEKDGKTKLVKTHCPICELVKGYEAQYEEMKANPRFSKEQLESFYFKNILQTKADKKFYFNAINQANEIGILPIPYKLFKSFEDLAKKQSGKGRDITGIKGAFVNFVKQSEYKGDNQVNYFAQLAMEEDQSTGDARIKYHELTQDIIALLKDQTADLGALYRTITAEQMATLANAETEEQRVQIVERIFGSNDKASDAAQDEVLAVNVEGVSGVQAVVRHELTPTGLKAVVPGAIQAAPTVTEEIAPKPATHAHHLTTPAPTPTATAPASGGFEAMSNEEFERTFGAKVATK